MLLSALLRMHHRIASPMRSMHVVVIIIKRYWRQRAWPSSQDAAHSWRMASAAGAGVWATWPLEDTSILFICTTLRHVHRHKLTELPPRRNR